MQTQRIFVAAAVVITLGATGLAFAQPPGGPGGPRGPGGGPGGPPAQQGPSPFPPPELAIHHVRDNIYQVLSAASGGIMVLTSDDGVLLIDTKFANEYDRYMELIRTVTDQPIRYVINTHMHPDHTGGNIPLESLGTSVIGNVRVTGVGPQIIATENARTGLAASQSAGLPSVTFDDHMRIWFAGEPLDLYWLGRGHTNGDLVVHMPEQGLLHAGDLFAGGDPSLRLIDYNGGGSLMEWSATLERAMELDFDTVIPGHREATTRDKLQEAIDEVVAIQDMVRELNDAGRSPEDINAAVVAEFGRYAFVVLPGIQAVLAELE